jgi:hypothetical protein
LTTSQRTLQDTAAKAGSVDTATPPVAATAATAAMAIFRLEKRLKPSLMPVLLHVSESPEMPSGVAVAGSGTVPRRAEGKPGRQGEVKA